MIYLINIHIVRNRWIVQTPVKIRLNRSIIVSEVVFLVDRILELLKSHLLTFANKKL